MKKLSKGLVTLAVLSAMSLMAAEDYTIYVNTFDDEDGTNPGKCSLREAVTAASTHKAYGGCPKGQPYSNVTNRIKLEAGEYRLNKELELSASVIIFGKDPQDYTKADPVSGKFPARTLIKTTINGQNQHRIFNTIHLNRPSLNLRDLRLINGNADRGGALLLGGATDLDNVFIENARAQQGGAIYLNDANSSITITGGLISKNQARDGAVLAMSCMDNLSYTRRTINITRSSIVENGDSSTQSIFSFCGEPTVNLSTNTISGNTANDSNGQIFQFVNQVNNQRVDLSTSATLSLVSNTIVNNAARTILLYGKVATKTLSYNVFSTNTGKACQYNDNDLATQENVGMILSVNALNFSGSQNVCDLTAKSIDEVRKDSVVLDGLSLSDLFTSTRPINDATTGFLPMYFPKDRGEQIDLVNVRSGGQSCSSHDQRGQSRSLGGLVQTSGALVGNCDVGSTEVLQLRVSNVEAVNRSVVTIRDEYQSQLDFYQKAVEDPNTNPEFLTYYRSEVSRYRDLLNAYNQINKYRPIFVDPYNISTNSPEEDTNSSTTRRIKHLNKDNYTVSVQALGVGVINAQGEFEGIPDTLLKCEWNENLQQIVLYRTDGQMTVSGDKEICRYTLTAKDGSNKQSSAYILGAFSNIQPIVPAQTEFVINPSNSSRISVDILSKASDDGDGNIRALEGQAANKPSFYEPTAGRNIPVYFYDLPDPVSVIAERQGPCPGNQGETCYGGQIQLQLNNTLDVFSYNIKYKVYDADQEASGEGIIHLKNAQTQPGSARSSGGGSVGGSSLLLLFGLVLLRRRYH